MVGFEYFGTGSDSPIPTPQIYYGENEEVPFVIVRTDHGELDYPTSAPTSRTGYSTNRYDGSGGVQLDGLWKRAAFAWRFRDLNVLLSGAINDDSRIMMRRQVIKRVKAIAPFLSVDADPYIARDRGRLVWIVDAYTTASRYPYSQTANFARASNGLIGGSGNYIRDSVKFVVDAKNGTVDGYVWDDEDPVLRSWLDVFPGLFKPRSQMPATVAEHVEYAEALFGIQTDRFANYHVTDAGAFYQKENAWLIGRDPATCLNNPGACAGAGSPAVPPTYMLARFPGDADAHFLLVRPFTPGGSAGRQNLAGYLTASSDPRDYGRLISYEFGDDVFGPEQVQANINQDPAVSQQIALWNQQHSKVIYGNLVIVPVGNTLLYVQPLYLRGEGSQIPELKRVVVVANGRVEMADTLPDALTLLLGRG
jgi:hypothetical protein